MGGRIALTTYRSREMTKLTKLRVIGGGQEASLILFPTLGLDEIASMHSRLSEFLGKPRGNLELKLSLVCSFMISNGDRDDGRV